MSVFLAIFGMAVGYYFLPSLEGALVGACIILIAYLILLRIETKNSASASKFIFGGEVYKFNKSFDSKLQNIVEEMTIASGLSKMPDVFVVDSDVPNAFACGVEPKKASIYVTRGLLEVLSRDELQGVVAHEIAHIVNRDTTYLLCTGVMAVLITACSRGITRGILESPSSRRRSSSSSDKGSAIIIIFALVLIILAPLISYLFYFSISRKREYLADACAVQYTRYPQGLANALKKISKNILDAKIAAKKDEVFPFEEDDDEVLSVETSKKDKILNSDNSFLCASCIVPFEAQREGSGLFSTHPGTRERIKILLEMSGADYFSYNEAFSKITGNKGVINSNDVKKSKRNSIEIPSFVLAAAARDDLGKTVSKKEKFDKKLEKKRETDDLMWKLANYNVIECKCGTKLKIPPCYKGLEIICPHCKTKHVI